MRDRYEQRYWGQTGAEEQKQTGTQMQRERERKIMQREGKTPERQREETRIMSEKENKTGEAK